MKPPQCSDRVTILPIGKMQWPWEARMSLLSGRYAQVQAISQLGLLGLSPWAPSSAKDYNSVESREITCKLEVLSFPICQEIITDMHLLADSSSSQDNRPALPQCTRKCIGRLLQFTSTVTTTWDTNLRRSPPQPQCYNPGQMCTTPVARVDVFLMPAQCLAPLQWWSPRVVNL